jgi:hypothetical protein
VKCFVAEYTSVLCRRFTPRPLESSERYLYGRETIADPVLHIGAARRNFEAFFAGILGKQGDPVVLQQEAEFLLLALQRLNSDFRNIQADYRRSEKQDDAVTLNNTMEAQTEEARQSKATSLKVSWLTQIAFFFLPLQMTTSILGMNLEAFGNGNVQASTFVVMALGIAIFATLPILWKLSEADIISFRIRRVAKCSPSAALIYGLFWLSERYTVWVSQPDSLDLSHWLWYLAFHEDIARRFDHQYISSRMTPEEMEEIHQRFLKNVKTSSSFHLSHSFWRRRITKLFSIINDPDWAQPRKRDKGHRD